MIRYSWGYNLLFCTAAIGFFLVIDIAFFSSSLLKLNEGGWFPLILGAAVSLVMLTWRRGREVLLERLRKSAVPLEQFLETWFQDPPQRVPGTAVFLAAMPEAVPHALLHNLEFNMVETSFFLSRETVIPAAANAGGMTIWRQRMFAAMARNAGNVVEYLNIPSNRVIELGTQVQL